MASLSRAKEAQLVRHTRSQSHLLFDWYFRVFLGKFEEILRTGIWFLFLYLYLFLKGLNHGFIDKLRLFELIFIDVIWALFWF